MIYVDTTHIEVNDKKAYVTLAQMQSEGFEFVKGSDPQNDPFLDTCDQFVTNSRINAETIALKYPNLSVYLIENPLNKDYKSDISNLMVVWCWNDFQFFVYFPRKSK
jgi:hypothetical protein